MAGGIDPGRLQVCGQDRRSCPDVGADVGKGSRVARLLPGMVVDDDGDRPVGRQRVVPGARLGVNEGHGSGLLPWRSRLDGQVRCSQPAQRTPQKAHQRPVLGPADHALVGNLALDAQLFRQQVA